MQKAIGSDIMMALDQCIPATAPYAQAETAMELTHAGPHAPLGRRRVTPSAVWNCSARMPPQPQNEECRNFEKLPFDGVAIGGLAVGETHLHRYEFTGLVTDDCREIPRYLMGAGTPIDILEAFPPRVDMFDCIIPSQLAQRGVVFTSHGKLQLRRSVYKFLEEPLDARCDCQTCEQYFRAYVHHLSQIR